MKDGLRVAVVGATGAVGKQLLSILQARQFPVTEILLFASARSEGKSIAWNGKSVPCRILQRGCFEKVDLAFFDASDAISQEWVPHAAESGAWVVDNSSTFRLEKDILLLVPEVNGDLLEARFKASSQIPLSARERIIAGPNCVAVPLAMALKPIQERWGIKRVVVSTYQSTSGAGAVAMEELSLQTRQVLDRKPIEPKAFKHPIAFNCIPHIGGFKEDGSTSEEQKVIAETQKMLGMPELRISVTAVRVPTFACHGESINIECVRPFRVEEVHAVLQKQKGIIVQDDPKTNSYPLGVYSAGQDAVYVGRIRKDESVEHGLNLWLVSDNLRKGAALNAVQVGEALLENWQY